MKVSLEEFVIASQIFYNPVKLNLILSHLTSLDRTDWVLRFVSQVWMIEYFPLENGCGLRKNNAVLNSFQSWFAIKN